MNSLRSCRQGALAGMALGLMLLAGCGDGAVQGINDDARVKVQLTDAPSDQIASAEVWISRVFLQGGPAVSGGGSVDLFNDEDLPRHYDLLDLRNGVIADLTDAVAVEPGSYSQLRFIVDRGKVTFVEGFALSDGSTEASLRVPAGSSSGIKVQLTEPVSAEEGAVTVILVDFDVDRNFVFQGPPSAPNSVLFTPTLLELDRGAGS